MHKLKQIWSNLESSLWFVPTLTVAGAIALAFGFIELEGYIADDALSNFPRLFGAGSDGARGMLTAIAGSMITVAGLTFSLTLAALAQASSQYTSRVLRNFMSDRANQIVLGFFVGVFTYCLIILRTIRGGDEFTFVPSLGVTFALVLALVSVGMLIFFIHHIATSIQASHIVMSAARETIEAVDRLFPQQLGQEADEEADEEMLANMNWSPIPSQHTGYIQAIDADDLLEFAKKRRLVVRMECKVGEFVTKESPLVSIVPHRAIDGDSSTAKVDLANDEADELANNLNDIYSFSYFRTVKQDANFGVRQIVDVALRALSPGINDTTTAVVCVDYLGAILAHLAPRRLETKQRANGDRVQVITRGETFTSMTHTAFDQIRRNAEGNVAVLTRLCDAIKGIAPRASNQRRRKVLSEQLRLVAEQADRSVEAPYDRALIKEHIEAAFAALGESKELYYFPPQRKETNC